MAANQTKDPTRGTNRIDAVTKITPIDPPVQIHHGNCPGGTLKAGGKIPPRTDSATMSTVPLANEIRAACSGCRRTCESEPLMLGWAPSKQPAANPMSTARIRTKPEVCKGSTTFVGGA